MMKWRVQGKTGCAARKSAAGTRSSKRVVVAATEERLLGTSKVDDVLQCSCSPDFSLNVATSNFSSDDVRASLDFLDKVIAEYNGNPTDNGATPPPENDASVPKASKGRSTGSPPADKAPDAAPPAHERFSINLVIVNDVVKEEQEESAADDGVPPPVPKRPPPCLPRSSSTGSVTSARDYPVSPPPRRRYLSPERRRRALMLNGNAANGVPTAHIPDSPDNRLNRPLRRPFTELPVRLDQRSMVQNPQKQPVKEPDTTATCQSDPASKTLLITGSQTYSDSSRSSPSQQDHLDGFVKDDVLRTQAPCGGELKPFCSPPAQTHVPKEFADLSSPMEVSRALVRTGSHAFDNHNSVSSGADIKHQDGFVGKDSSLRRQVPSPICSRTFFYSSLKPCAMEKDEASPPNTDGAIKGSLGIATRADSSSPHHNHCSDITEGEIVTQNKVGSCNLGVLAHNGRPDSEDSNAVRVVSGRYSPNGTIQERDNTRLTVTFRTLPETGSFRRKSESRNSIHVDFNVRDGLPWNGRAQSSAGSNGDTGESGHSIGSTTSLCRSRSLRSHRNPELSDGHSAAASRTTDDFSPPPLPPRKAKEEARRQAEENASPTLKRVTFQVLPTTHENCEQGNKDRTTAGEKSRMADDCPEDGFFTRPPPKAQSPVVGKGRAASPMCHRAVNGSHSPVGKIREPSPQCQRRLNGCAKAPAAAKANGVQSRAGTRDSARTQGHATKDAKATPVTKKTFEPPSAASDVSTDCYNVYNVRTGKISSTVTKPNALGRSTARVPLESVQCSNGTAGPRKEGQLTKLRNMSPTREAEKLIGKIISRCKSSAVLNGKDKKPASSPTPASSDAASAQPQPQLLKLTARQQQRHSRCTKCALAQAK